MSGTRQEAIAIATALLNTYILSNNNKLEVSADSCHFYTGVSCAVRLLSVRDIIAGTLEKSIFRLSNST